MIDHELFDEKYPTTDEEDESVKIKLIKLRKAMAQMIQCF